MGRIIDKLLVIITISVAMIFAITTFFVDFLVPKNIDTENGLIFGNKNAKVTLVMFEDFKCKYCKEYFNETFPEIKERYIDTGKIKYVIIPLSFIYGSKLLTNAAIGIYELKKDQFFEFISIVSEKKSKNLTKQDLIKIASNLKGVNLEIFNEFLDQKVFNNYLDENMEHAKKIMPTFEVPAVYINGHRIDIDKIENAIEDRLTYKEYK
ncbi:MAG: Disulfide bond formation protein D [Candidatus Anoxychlamydiales bacterium]|nr:Disulfide bond formation protein D [Candidatus Anoxychlamydiales bacterium]NGX41173.1 Disulfide bond formation protein D [Candidatus Anoxychlamydiales bacterium]